VEEEMESVVKELTVDAHNTSQARRKKESAGDDRKSAQTIGLGAIIAIIVIPIILIIVADIPAIYRDIHGIRQKVKSGKSKPSSDGEDKENLTEDNPPNNSSTTAY
jgi:hypothetical protein